MQIPLKLQSEDCRGRVAGRVPAPQTHALPRADRALHAARRDSPEAQYLGAPPLHPRPQREDIPLFGGQRLGARRRAPRRARAATTAHAQPLPRQTEGNIQKIPALHSTARRLGVTADASRRGQSQLDIAPGYLSH